MKRHLVSPIVSTAVVLIATAAASAESWLFLPSTFTHDPTTGTRVNQYAPKEPAIVHIDGTYLQSGYRHMRFGIQAGGSADRLHVVQTWGAGEAIRPYGEWQFPFRAGATPYGPWGNPGGPWTMPFDSWVNPYGSWNRYHYSPWGPGYGGSHGPGYGGARGPGPGGSHGSGHAPPHAAPHHPGPAGPGHHP